MKKKIAMHIAIVTLEKIQIKDVNGLKASNWIALNPNLSQL